MNTPNCCAEAKSNRTVRLFVPAGERPSFWCVPLVNEDDEPVRRTTVHARYCPFCGVALGPEHLAFEEKAPVLR